ncbi:uncharacterized protein TNCV_4281811 [Trichonephila clavipes]|nr:uncharacterized protein TNCV_4281811 [Trichonephila clavipes]
MARKFGESRNMALLVKATKVVCVLCSGIGKKWHVDPKRFVIPGIVPLRQEDTLNSRRAVSPLVRLVEGGDKWETPGHLQGVLPQNWGGTEPNRTVTCVVLRATANDRRKTSPLSR